MEINKTETNDSRQCHLFVNVLIDSWQQKCQMEINKTETNNSRQCRSFVNMSIDLWQHTCQMEVDKNEMNNSWQCQSFVNKMIVEIFTTSVGELLSKLIYREEALSMLIVALMFEHTRTNNLFNNYFQLVVKLISILISEGAQAPSSKLIVGCGYSKLSFHFCKDCRIFYEGVKDSTIGIFSDNGLVDHSGLDFIGHNGLLDFISHNGLLDFIGQNGLVGFIGLGLVGFIGLSLVSLVKLIGQISLVGLGGFGFVGLHQKWFYAPYYGV